MNRNIVNGLLIFVLILGLAGVVFQERIWDKYHESKFAQDSRPSLGELRPIKGPVQIRPPQSSVYIKITSPAAVHARDTVLVANEGSAELALNGATPLSLSGGTLLIVNERPVRPSDLEFTLLRGEAREAKTEQEMIPQEEQKVTKNLEPEKDPFTPVIENQKRYFYKCYSDYLKKSPNGTGIIVVSVRIEVDGHVTLTRILSNTFADSEMLSCVAQVFSRTKFKAFQGDPKIINYPIRFDEPKND